METVSPTIHKGDFLYHLAVLTRRWRRILDQEFHSAGLTDASWRPLLHLHHLGDGIRQKELAASVGIEGPSLVRLLDTLTAKGLIERTEDALDRRAKQLSLTPAGRELVTRIQATATALENELFGSFKDSEMSRMADFIERLEAAVNSIQQRGRP